MASLQAERVVPGTFAITDPVAERITYLLAQALAPGLARAVGPVDWKHGADAGRDWTAEGLLDDGTTVIVCLRPATRQVTLLLTNDQPSPAAIPSWYKYLLLTFIAAGGLVGLLAHSVWWGAGVTFGLLVAEMMRDIVAREMRRRRASDRLDVDSQAWKARLDASLEEVRRTFDE